MANVEDVQAARAQRRAAHACTCRTMAARRSLNRRSVAMNVVLVPTSAAAPTEESTATPAHAAETAVVVGVHEDIAAYATPNELIFSFAIFSRHAPGLSRDRQAKWPSDKIVKSSSLACRLAPA